MSATPNILVTGVGAIIGHGIIKSLRSSGRTVRIIGIDRSDQSAGPSFCDAFRQKPKCEESDPAYLAFWHALLIEERIDVVLPGLEVDVQFLDSHRAAFEGASSRIVLNRSELIHLSSDKWSLHEALGKLALDRIPSVQTSAWEDAVKALGPPPLLLKPRRGSASRGIVRLQDAEDLAHALRKAGDNWMLQRIVGGDDEEYTVGAFGLGDGTALSPIIFRRRLSASGNTQSAEVVEDATIAEATARLCQAFAPLGPTNFQFRKERDVAFLLEINPRFSSSCSLRTAFGYNEAEMCLAMFLDGRRPDPPSIRPGKAWRYTEDMVVHAGHSR